jgi:sec-independent protein translocase protein TatA
MFGFGMPEIVILLVLALIVFGPQKLPELCRSLGRGMAEFKRASNDFRRRIEDEARTAEIKEPEVKDTMAGEAMEPAHQSVENTGKMPV